MDRVSPGIVLGEIARRNGRKVRRIRLLDPNVCHSSTALERPWEIVEDPPGDLFSRSLSLNLHHHKVTLRSNREYLIIEVAAELDVDVCSINRKDRIGWTLTQAILSAGFPAPIFSQNAELTRRQQELLTSPELSRLIEKIRFEQNESLHVYRNGLNVYLRPTSVEATLAIIEQMCGLVDSNIHTQVETDFSDLPPTLQVLVPLIRRWGITDDDQRAEILDSVPTLSLELLVRAVKPHLPAIDTFLNSFGEKALSESAISLGALAECALEAEQMLRKHTKN